MPAAGELIPLSHLALDLPMPPEGWPVFLGRRAITIRPDSLGRDSVTATAARQLLHEQREDEVRRQRHLKAVEAEAVERDRLFRASLPRPLPADALPDGVLYGDLLRQAAKDARPKRKSMLEESLSGDTLTFHSLQDAEAS